MADQYTMVHSETALRSFLQELQCPVDAQDQLVAMRFTHKKFYDYQADFRMHGDDKNPFRIPELDKLTSDGAKRIHRAILYVHCMHGYPGNPRQQNEAFMNFSYRAFVAFEQTFQHHLPTKSWWLFCSNHHIRDCIMYTVAMRYGVKSYDDLAVLMQRNKQLTNVNGDDYRCFQLLVNYITESGITPDASSATTYFNWKMQRP